MASSAPSDRTRVRRHPERGVYGAAEIDAILDEGFVCHVGFVASGQPYVMPMGYGRAGTQLFVHGSGANRMLRALAGGEAGSPVCVTVTIADGLVLARSAFHNSLNYRSVVVLGRARLVTEPAAKMDALRCLTNHIMPGRWEEGRPPSDDELKATMVLAIPLDEASAKVRTGPPLDAEDDYSIPVWAGIVPLRGVVGEPVPDGRVLEGVPPVEARRFLRRRKG
jgi:nitroimidazol reductase NimA-like FMN-containing flavoprotein (pyridoxamine 5'-phosphate oxidase superfamily)